jgi:hypothetical protein
MKGLRCGGCGLNTPTYRYAPSLARVAAGKLSPHLPSDGVLARQLRHSQLTRESLTHAKNSWA